MVLSMSAYTVLGLIARHGPMTPYELKARVEQSVAYFWPIPHAQLYRDPPRLAEMGLLTEEAEAAWATAPGLPPDRCRP